jgi:hypothetical protein
MVHGPFTTAANAISISVKRLQMELAAIAAIDDYSGATELTAFTVLDGEDFHPYFRHRARKRP